MSRERRTWPEPKPAITLEGLQTIGEHVIAAWPYWFRGRARRLDRLLAEYGYERQSRVAWERAGDDSASSALVMAYDHDSEAVVPVAVIGTLFFSELFGDPGRAARQGGTPP